MPKNLWIDVEDLFEYSIHRTRPSGIQRLSFEIYQVLQENYGSSGFIHFVRHDKLRQSFTVVPWSSVAGLFAKLTENDHPDQKAPTPITGPRAKGIKPELRLRLLVRRMAHRLPLDLRLQLLSPIRLQLQAVAAFVSLLIFVARAGSRKIDRWFRSSWKFLLASLSLSDPAASKPAEDFAHLVKPGDYLVVLGGTWGYPDYAKLVEANRTKYGIEFVLLIYDIIPVRRPEWCDRNLVRAFSTWLESLLPCADRILTISRSCANDLERHALETGISLHSTLQPIPIGTGFTPGRHKTSIPAQQTRQLPAAGSYVLFVSTIEPRKNHTLLFRVWRRMLEEMPAETVPILIFAGKVGWMTNDLMEQLANVNYLNDKIQIIEGLSDAELEALYRGCLFTVFPSFYEGWGLPVTESLAFGKPCIASNATSVPEAGGKLARYFDPENTTEAYAVIRATIEDPVGLRAWEAEIVRSFKPVSWDATADAILGGLNSGLSTPSPRQAGPTEASDANPVERSEADAPQARGRPTRSPAAPP